MGFNLPDPDTFGESEPKPHEKINDEDYHSLDEWDE